MGSRVAMVQPATTTNHEALAGWKVSSCLGNMTRRRLDCVKANRQKGRGGGGGKAMEGEGEPPVLIPFPTPRSFGCARSAYSQSRVTFHLTRLCWVIRKKGRTFAKSLFLFLSMAHKWLNILLCISFTPSVYHRYIVWQTVGSTRLRESGFHDFCFP